MFTNYLKKFSDKVSSLLSVSRYIYFDEKERKRIWDKLELEGRISVFYKRIRIKVKKTTFREKISTFHQTISLKSRIIRIWSNLQKKPLTFPHLEKHLDEIRTNSGFTREYIDNMTASNPFVGWLSLINNPEKNDSPEELKRIITRNHFKNRNILPWDPRLGEIELPSLAQANDSLITLENFLKEIEQLQKKMVEYENQGSPH